MSVKKSRSRFPRRSNIFPDSSWNPCGSVIGIQFALQFDLSYRCYSFSRLRNRLILSQFKKHSCTGCVKLVSQPSHWVPSTSRITRSAGGVELPSIVAPLVGGGDFTALTPATPEDLPPCDSQPQSYSCHSVADCGVQCACLLYTSPSPRD